MSYAPTYCAPGDDQNPVFILRFNDPDQRDLVFSDEAEARERWEFYCGPSGHWNGYLFGLVPYRSASAPAVKDSQ